MLGLRLRKTSPIGRMTWPSPDNGTTSLFSGRPPLREMVLLVDASLLDSVRDDDRSSPLRLLAGLLTHPYLRVYRYADSGPPHDVARESTQWSGDFVRGWAVVGPRENETEHQSLIYATGGSVTRAGIMGNVPDIAAQDTRHGAYADLQPAEASARRRNDAVAAQVADAVHADVFITERPYLYAVTWNLGRDVTFARPQEVLAIIGLYLRTQGEFQIWRSLDGRGSRVMNLGLFYWIGTRDLLPSGWRWFTACLLHATGRGDDHMTYLAGSAFQRVQRALQARDDANRALNNAHNWDTAEAALSSLDIVLLMLMGAVDVTARVAHHVLNLDPDKSYQASWQRRDWMRLVERDCPSLAAIFAKGSREAHIHTILRLLRNSIHGASLNVVAVSDARADRRTLIGLPTSDQEKLLSAMDALDGRAAWGVQEILTGRFHAEPSVLLERIFSGVIALLNRVMEQTPVEGLPHVDLAPGDLVPPDDDEFGIETRLSIRWQLGVSET